MRIGLMGFGRIGRNIFRILDEMEDGAEVVAISDIANHESLEYLLQYDTIMGRLNHRVRLKEGYLYSRGRQIKMLSGRDAGDVTWGHWDVDVVIEARGLAPTRLEAQVHLKTGAKRIISCVPTLGGGDYQVVMGRNDEGLTSEHKIIDSAPVQTQCSALSLDILDKAFGIEHVFLSTVHAYTNDQSLADVPSKDLRRSRAARENIIPLDLKLSKNLELLFPHLEGKIKDLALKVPVPNGSMVDLVVSTKREVSVTAVNEVMRSAIEAKYPNYMEFIDEPIVSSDVQLSTFSNSFDSLATMCLGDRLVKTVSWFDDGTGTAHRVVNLLDKLGESEGGLL